ncbi:putative DNA-binding WGR domain protein [Parabacteroides sp. PF5-5]|uniref:STM4015 family protein n=1 Tax=unclassified Parabacteroides TaxID=2649774 RepID=UPI002476B5EC|nr:MULTISPECIES: STM4015 family protein [unclassified Parabacteroides]MDH6307043.1 putative DNA-binding WGR domain protein [Parabacteroides sp. PH5-39]MDH6317958.1 putative DNA-binding WGR domain protein [Parabacteroides sp. PF5-13]MDH6321689.1 putative DNA-binding WGR domain protein [Parabacteroides sp. PH5-13]MDH6325440.1 putative DNA-binding WGR domain protein [Parabacteroides sp. PH5-8]MDH6329151.1 putative DNA-binding WGR domain protein [Parabacteroides sp. PH5-41]
MKRVFVFQDFKSQKFWSIDVDGSCYTVNYGKLGTDGQTQQKEFSSPEEAQKAADKLIAEKTKKGYVETREETAQGMKVEAKKYKLTYDDYDDGKTQEDLLNKIIKDKKLPEIKQLTIGCWDFESGDCQELVDGIIANKEKFAHIEGLFWGDIDSEETEISWIEQTNLSPLLDIMPELSELKIKGTNNLSIGQKPRPNLKSLEIISGGLPSSVVEDVIKSDFPNLEELILYVGVEDYGYDGSIEQFKPLFSKSKFPKLTSLGLVNAEEQDAIVKLFLESDILPQLETMDISCGVLTDKGAQLLLDNVEKIKHLKFIDMRYNYLTEEMKKKLSKLPMKIDVAESEAIDEEYEEYGGYPMITE